MFLCFSRNFYAKVSSSFILTKNSRKKPMNKNIIQLTEKHVAGTYGRFPIVLVKGKGSKVWDKSGKQYIDFVSGLAVNNLGHCHPSVVTAIKKQAEKLIHVSNLYHIEPQSQLAEKLTSLSFADKIFFCNSGQKLLNRQSNSPASIFSTRGSPGKPRSSPCTTRFTAAPWVRSRQQHKKSFTPDSSHFFQASNIFPSMIYNQPGRQ